MHETITAPESFTYDPLGSKINLGRKVTQVIVAMGLILAPSLASSEAHAGTSCYGDYCSGLDPNATGCAEGATTIAHTDIEQYYTLVEAQGGRRVYENKGRLDLRWSPTCKTKWARLSLNQGTDIYSVVTEQARGYSQTKNTSGYIGTTKPGIYYTNMIYSPGVQCYAYVEGQRLQPNSTHWE